jgi:DNA-binding transcriptional regulator GbsR (MarR family)
VSGMARLLEQIGLVRRRTKPGDRREYFDIPPDALHRLMEVTVVRLRQNRQMAEAGLELIAQRPAESQARLRDIRDLYAFFEREWPAILQRLHESQSQAQTQTQTDADAGRIGERKEVTA